jgi:hypothetical protein
MYIDGCGLGIGVMLTGKPGNSGRISLRLALSRYGTAAARYGVETSTAKLAKFFPDATPVRLPVTLTRMGAETGAAESTVIEFGTAREVLFASRLPLEFADKVRVQTPDGSLDAEACVVALQYQTGTTAVAARFTGTVANWIVKS